MRALIRPAIITGASRGLGAAIARALAVDMPVVLTARSGDAIRSLVDELGPAALGVVADISQQADVSDVVNQAVRRFGAPAILINNAAVLGPIGPFWLVAPSDWESVYRTNVHGAYLMMRAVVPYMARSGGQILGISSGGAVNPIAHHAAYGLSKVAFDELHRRAQLDLGTDRVAIALVDPGGMDTDMMRAVQAAEFPAATAFRQLAVGEGLRPVGQVAAAVSQLLGRGIQPGYRYDIRELLQLDSGTEI